MNFTTKTLPGIGEVCFKRNPRAKHLNIRVKLFDGVHVTVPARMSLTRAQKLVRQKEGWIKKHQAENEQLKNASLFADDRPIKTRYHTVLLKQVAVEKVALEFQGQTVHLIYPENVELSGPPVQRAIRNALIEIYRKEAKEYLPTRVEYLADQFGLTYNRVFIKNHKSRWGSCSARNNINLSLHLMRLPDRLIDYVILHELVHTEIKNHSPAFWKRVSEVCPKSGALRKELRQVGKQLLPL